jgi:two-component system chemotaxis response regulator CheB
VFAIVVIGTSTGGLTALKQLLGALPEHFPLPVAVAQHRHRDSDNRLGDHLQPYLVLPIKEVEDKDALLPGHIYLAPADYHLLVEPEHLSLSIDEPVSFARPSIDVLFESAADTYTDQVIGIILTGANQDGARGLAKIKAYGGVAIAQDPTTAENGTMPQAAINTLSVDYILPLTAIAPCLIDLCCSLRR